MNQSETSIKPIPISYIVEHANTKTTEARKMPYKELILKWGKANGCESEAELAIKGVGEDVTLFADKMPKEFTPRFRQKERAEKLMEIIRCINDKISTDQENWTWAHVMKVMIDEGIIFSITPNKFDTLIRGMIPGKNKDTIRKHGDYSIIKDEEPWSEWTSQSFINPGVAADRMICETIAQEFSPVLERKIARGY